jgi:hypothetical protein
MVQKRSSKVILLHTGELRAELKSELVLVQSHHHAVCLHLSAGQQNWPGQAKQQY